MPQVVFRADAGAKIGAGHAMRCLALSEAFEAAGWSSDFAATAETFAAIAPLAPIPGEPLILSDGNEEPAALRARWPGGVDALVVDHYRRDRAFESQCRPWARRILVVDDLADRPHDADVLVDASASSAEPYRPHVSPSCRVLTGASYAIVASRFAPIRDRSLQRDRSEVRRLLISFGQNDAAHATGAALDALDRIGFAGEVDVVLGASAPHLNAVQGRMGEARRLHVNASNMQDLMRDADLAIGAAGATAWERCYLGVPSVLVLLADNQRGNVEIVVQGGAGVDAGGVDTGLADRLATLLAALISDRDGRQALSLAAARLVDGRGRERILEAVVNG